MLFQYSQFDKDGSRVGRATATPYKGGSWVLRWGWKADQDGLAMTNVLVKDDPEWLELLGFVKDEYVGSA